MKLTSYVTLGKFPKQTESPFPYELGVLLAFPYGELLTSKRAGRGNEERKAPGT